MRLTPDWAVMMIAIRPGEPGFGMHGEPCPSSLVHISVGEWRHPVQVYEILGALFILLYGSYPPFQGTRQ